MQVYVRRINIQNNRNFRIIELGELQGNRIMQIVIGTFEAEYIAAAMDNRVFKRPMPYDVISEIFKAYNIYLHKIIIFVVRNNVLYARLILGQENDMQEIVVRISDAIALAMQLKVPIYVEKEVLDNFFTMCGNRIEQYLSGNIPLAELGVDELRKKMSQAAEDENYELAAEIRNEITKREK